MSRRQADWIDRRLRQTTYLGEASALVANDIVANLPPATTRPFVMVVEVCSSSLQGVYADLPENVLVVLVDHDEAELDPENGAYPYQVKPLAALDNVCKAVMFDAGSPFGERDHQPDTRLSRPSASNQTQPDATSVRLFPCLPEA